MKGKDQNRFFEGLYAEHAGDLFYFETCSRRMGYKTVAGVDEVGRGALAGPVLAAAVILPDDICKIPDGIRDSKQLTRLKREELFPRIIESAISVGVGIVDSKEIDRTSILKASLRAMEKAVSKLNPRPDIVLVDGNQKFSCAYNQREIVKGDNRSLSIAAASIIAKVIRDNIMSQYHCIHPYYNFNLNMGYGTKKHIEGIINNGSCPIHRTTFRGVIIN